MVQNKMRDYEVRFVDYSVPRHPRPGAITVEASTINVALRKAIHRAPPGATIVYVGETPPPIYDVDEEES